MIARRDILMGGACVVAAGAALALRPRRHVSLLGKDALATIVPRQFGDWSSHDVSDLVAPKTEDNLSAKLYNQTVGRVYRNLATGSDVMVLIAHGDTQSDSLQLHRPEVCYPAFGFAISDNRPLRLRLSGEASIPARRLVAKAPGRRESIVYWSRLGDFMPVNSGEQRLDRLKTAMGGYVADGLLARFSMTSLPPEEAFPVLQDFVLGLVAATPVDKRKVLIGERLVRAMIGAKA